MSNELGALDLGSVDLGDAVPKESGLNILTDQDGPQNDRAGKELEVSNPIGEGFVDDFEVHTGMSAGDGGSRFAATLLGAFSLKENKRTIH